MHDALKKVRERFCGPKKKTEIGKRLDFEDFCDLVSRGAVFYLGHDTPLFNPSVHIESHFKYVVLDGEYDCYSNGCVFKFSLPPHTDIIKIIYDREIPDKEGYHF